MSEHPPTTVTEIERLNRLTFDALADEYSDSTRPTTANFHDLSRRFFEHYVSEGVGPEDMLLDLGAGTGFVLSLPGIAGRAVLSIDLSFRMLEHIAISENCRCHRICGSAFALPIGNSAVSRVVSSLASCFLRSEALKEVNRVLKQGGLFAFSTPSKIWSQAIRDQEAMEKTLFVTRTGSFSAAFSFTYDLDEMSQLLNKNDFDVLDLTVSRGIDLREYNRPISAALSEAAKQPNLSFDEMPILELYVCRKRGSRIK